jgi:hypothetical protein
MNKNLFNALKKGGWLGHYNITKLLDIPPTPQNVVLNQGEDDIYAYNTCIKKI